MSQTTTTTTTSKKHDAAVRFARQAENLGLAPRDKEDDSDEVDSTTAVRAIFVTEHDPVIVTASGDRLPAVPLTEAQKLNELREEIEKRDNSNEKVGADSAAESDKSEEGGSPVGKDLEGTFRHKHGDNSPETSSERKSSAPLGSSLPPSRTNPLFPPLPLYGPPSLLRTLQCYVFRFTSFWLSLGFLAVVVLGSAFTSIPLMFMHIWLRLTFRHPDSRRPFNEEEKRRKEARKEADKAWKRDKRKHNNYEKTGYVDKEGEAGHTEEFVPTEGGPDPIVCDVGYYARRVGLDMEEYKVQTEDGFIITLWHIYNPREYTPATVEERGPRDPTVFEESSSEKKSTGLKRRSGPRRYPILLIHGLLQSAGAYCTNDDDSLAFYLAKRYLIHLSVNLS